MEPSRSPILTLSPQTTDSFQISPLKRPYNFSVKCVEARLISITNIFILLQTIAAVIAICANRLNTSGIKDKVTNIIANSFLCIESPTLYLILTKCILPDKELSTLLLSLVNLGHDEFKISKVYTLAYFTPVKYDNLLDIQKNNQASEL